MLMIIAGLFAGMFCFIAGVVASNSYAVLKETRKNEHIEQLENRYDNLLKAHKETASELQSLLYQPVKHI